MLRSVARVFVMLTVLSAVLVIVPYAVFAGQAAAGGVAVVVPQGTVPTTPPGTIPRREAFGSSTSARDQSAAEDVTSDAVQAPLPVRPYRMPRRGSPTPPRASEVRDAALLLIDGMRVRNLAGDPHSDVLFAATMDRRLFRSADGGLTWQPVAEQPQTTAFLMSAANPDVLYAGTGDACAPAVNSAPFLRSTDGGVTWETLPTAAGLIPMLVHPADADKLLAADCALPFASADGGVTWAGKPDESAAQLWTEYRILGMAAATLAGGATPNWDYLYVAGQTDAGDGAIAYSGDEGATWERITPLSNPTPQHLRAWAVDRHTAGRLWFVDANGVWATDDFGAMWMLVNAGLDDLTTDAGFAADAVTSLVYVDGHGLYLGSHQGLFVLGDEAEAWQPVDVTAQGDDPDAAPVVNALLALDAAPDSLWVTTDRGVVTLPLE